MKTRVLLADSEEMFRPGLAALLNARDDVVVVAQASTGSQARRVCRGTPVDVAVVEYELPVLGGVETTRAILEQSAHIRVIIVARECSRETVCAALAAHARGFLVRRNDLSSLIAAIKRVREGAVYLCRQAQSAAADMLAGEDDPRPASPLADLTSTERRVGLLMAEDLPTREICDHLGLSPRTLERVRSELREKLSVRTNCGIAMRIATLRR